MNITLDLRNVRTREDTLLAGDTGTVTDLPIICAVLSVCFFLHL
jgi:hypothetical protein